MTIATDDPLYAPDPLALLVAWHREAVASGEPEPDAMSLATATPEGVPSVRVVLFRGVTGGGVRFFTNYTSRKGRELDANPRAALAFFWPRLTRQVRVEGRVERLSPEESDEYFRTRPRGHQLGAWASPQSQVVPSLDVVRARHAELAEEQAGVDVPRPPHWGGYRVVPEVIEFWTAGADRLHQRIRFRRDAAGWAKERLAP